MNEYSHLFHNIYKHFQEDEKQYSNLLKKIDELNQAMKAQLNKFETEKFILKISNHDVSTC